MPNCNFQPTEDGTVRCEQCGTERRQICFRTCDGTRSPLPSRHNLYVSSQVAESCPHLGKPIFIDGTPQFLKVSCRTRGDGVTRWEPAHYCSHPDRRVMRKRRGETERTAVDGYCLPRYIPAGENATVWYGDPVADIPPTPEALIYQTCDNCPLWPGKIAGCPASSSSNSPEPPATS
jgi:hypothetical protein